MRILVVEDEPKTVAYLRDGLTEHGFAVEVATRGDEGLLAAKTGEHDLLILDVMLPHRDGWDIVSEVRQRGKTTPVLFLTARDSVEDRVRGLELGADDYLVKPFAFAELLARVHALLRRTRAPAGAADDIAVSDLRLDPLQQRAFRGGRDLPLTAKEFVLLALLMRHAGDVLPRRLIAEQVWGLPYHADSRVLDVAVRRLRSKVDDPFPTRLIHTVRGIGYVLEVR